MVQAIKQYIMKEFTVRPRMGERSFKLLEKIVNGTCPDYFKEFMKKYSGLSIIEDCYIDSRGENWIVAAFDNFKSILELTKEFKEKGWGLKIPFAYDQGGWHFCLSFDGDLLGKIIVNRWTDHDESEQFVVIADSFEDFIEGLQKRPEGL